MTSTAKQHEARIAACRKTVHEHVTKARTTTPKEFFATLSMPSGDFIWECEAGDWHVYNCCEKDCSVQWHTIASAMEIGRRDGKLYVETSTVDSDGNWDCSGGWTEGEPDAVFMECLDRENTDEYFTGWARYWLDAIETRKDPCDQITRALTDEEWVEFCLKAAEDNVKYLTMSAGD